MNLASLPYAILWGIVAALLTWPILWLPEYVDIPVVIGAWPVVIGVLVAIVSFFGGWLPRRSV